MSYYAGLYERFYTLFCSAVSWHVFVFILALAVVGVAALGDSKVKNKDRITKGLILFTICHLILKILLWLFLPVPSGG